MIGEFTKNDFQVNLVEESFFAFVRSLVALEFTFSHLSSLPWPILYCTPHENLRKKCVCGGGGGELGMGKERKIKKQTKERGRVGE